LSGHPRETILLKLPSVPAPSMTALIGRVRETLALPPQPPQGRPLAALTLDPLRDLVAQPQWCRGGKLPPPNERGTAAGQPFAISVAFQSATAKYTQPRGFDFVPNK